MIEIPEEVESEMTPLVKAFVVSAFARLEQRTSQLDEQVE